MVPLLPLLAWRNWQTRTAQDRMGKPVEVRVLSRAESPIYLQRGQIKTLRCQFERAGYFLAAAFLLAAHRAFISSESFLRPAAVSVPFLFAGAFFLPAAFFLLAAQRAFISWESFLRPAAVS